MRGPGGHARPSAGAGAGVQGRYFLPILPLMLFLLGGLRIETKYSSQAVTKLICISGIIIQLYTLTALLAVHL